MWWLCRSWRWGVGGVLGEVGSLVPLLLYMGSNIVVARYLLDIVLAHWKEARFGVKIGVACKVC